MKDKRPPTALLVLVYIVPLCILAAAIGGDGEDWFVGAMLGLGSYAVCLWLIIFWRPRED